MIDGANLTLLKLPCKSRGPQSQCISQADLDKPLAKVPLQNYGIHCRVTQNTSVSISSNSACRVGSINERVLYRRHFTHNESTSRIQGLCRNSWLVYFFCIVMRFCRVSSESHNV